MRRFTLSIIGVAALIGTVPDGARAARLVVIVRGTGAGSDKAAGYVSWAARQAFAQDERYEIVNMDQTLGSGSERADRAFEVAEEMAQKGQQAYESLDLDAAVESLNTALAKYERHSGNVTDMKKVASVLMLLGATHLLRGEEKTGEKRLAQARAMVPDIEPDPAIFNPAMRQVFDRAVEKLAQRPAGTLTVSSNPSYGEVYVDGVFVGVTPATVDGMREGRHFVRVVKDGYRSWGKVLDVIAGAEAAETASLKPTSRFEDFDSLADQAIVALSSESEKKDAPMSDSVDQLGVLLNGDHLFLAEVRLDGERVEVRAAQYNLNEQKRVKYTKQVFSYDARPETYERELGDMVKKHFGDATLARDTRATGAAASETGLVHAGSGSCPGGMTCSDFKLVLLLGGAGGGALFMAIGGILWGVATGQNTDFRGQGDPLNTPVQGSQEALDLESAGRGAAVAGDVLFFLGAAVAATGVALFFLWDPAPSAEDVAKSSGGGWSFNVVPLTGGAGVVGAVRF